MTAEIITEIESLFAKLKAAVTPAVDTAISDAETAGLSALNYIKTNGLQDAYQIALTVVGAAVAGSPWTATLASVEASIVTAGKSIAKGAVAVVSAQAQADLIAAGTLLPPVSATAS